MLKPERLALLLLFCLVANPQPPSQGKAKLNAAQQQPAVRIQNSSGDDQRGTEKSPVVVRILPPGQVDNKLPLSQDKEGKQSTDWWMFGVTVMLAVIGTVQTRVFWVQAQRLKETVEKMEEIAGQQTADVKASIAEATRAASAMEEVSESLAISAESVKVSVAISREIADRQKLVTELQSRAYLSAIFQEAIFQDDSHNFGSLVLFRNHGNTPAYDVTFKAAAQILPFPVPDDFQFPLDDGTAAASVSLMAPGITKTIRRNVPARVPENQIDSIKRGGPPMCLAMWGSATYRDAFKETRHLKFAFTVSWSPWLKGMDRDRDGQPKPEQIYSHDTMHHNDGD